MKKRIFALLVAVVMIFTLSFGAVSAYAEDTDLNYAESTFDTVVEAIWNAGFAGLELSLDAFKVAVEVGGWIWDGATFTLTDPLTNISYGILEDGTLGRSGRSGGGGRIRVDTASDIDVSGKTFSEICKQLEAQYGPQIGAEMISWKNNRTYHVNASCFEIFNEGTIAGINSFKGVYLLPFYRQGDKYYYRLEQFHLYTAINDDGTQTLYMSVYNNAYPDTPYLTCQYNEDVSVYRYILLELTDGRGLGFNDYSNYISHGRCNSYGGWNSYVYDNSVSVSSTHTSVGKYYLSTDLSRYHNLRNNSATDRHANYYYMSYNAPSSDDDFDMGYYISTEPHTPGDGRVPDITPENIDPDSTVTLTGDTIYEYTITNAEGDSTTINYYINNNYTIPDTPKVDSGEDDSSGTGGTVGGDVTVSGDIGVNGSVDVNINVNGGSGVTTDPYDYADPNVEEALNQLPEMGDGFISFFSNMFAWLPAEVLGLLIGGIGLAIVCRIAGR